MSLCRIAQASVLDTRAARWAAVNRAGFSLDTRRDGASGYALDARFSPRCPLPLLSRAKDDAAIEPNHSARAETRAKV